MKRNWPSIEYQWKEAGVDVLKVGFLIASSQPSFYRFTHGPSGGEGLFLLYHRRGKMLALL